MKDQLEARLRELRGEYDNGQRMLRELETRENELRQTLLRIAGAIQVLEELLGHGEVPGDVGAGLVGDASQPGD